MLATSLKILQFIGFPGYIYLDPVHIPINLK